MVRCGSENWDIPMSIVKRSGYLSKLYEAQHNSHGSMNIDMPVRAGADNVAFYFRFVLGSLSRLSHLPTNKSEEAIKQCYRDLARAYSFSITLKMADRETRNDVVRSIVELSNLKSDKGSTLPPPGGVVNQLWQTGIKGIQDLMVDLWVHVTQEQIEQELKAFPDQFSVDLLRKLLLQQNVGTRSFVHGGLKSAVKQAGGTYGLPRITKPANEYTER